MAGIFRSLLLVSLLAGLTLFCASPEIAWGQKNKKAKAGKKKFQNDSQAKKIRQLLEMIRQRDRRIQDLSLRVNILEKKLREKNKGAKTKKAKRGNHNLSKRVNDLELSLATKNRMIKSYKDRNLILLNRIRELEIRIAQLATSSSKEKKFPQSDQKLNAPGESVKGKVLKVDAANKIVEISLGREDGLRKDHTLEVFRTQPRPTYLGMIRIIAVETNRSVGMMVGRNLEVKVGDEVASKLNPK